MATDYIQTLKSTGGDFSLMSTWEAATQCDLTAATTKVFSHGGITGAIADNASVTGASSGATGTVVAGPTSTQILIDGITGTFTSGEAVEVDGSNYVTISDAGDSPIAVLECYAFTCTDSVAIASWTTGASNFITITGITRPTTLLSTGFILSSASGRPLDISNVPYCVVDGITFNATGSYSGLVVQSPASNATVKNSAVISARTGTGTALSLSASSSLIYNSVVKNTSSGRGCDTRTPTGVSVSNCTFISTGSATYGLLTDSANVVTNTVSYGYGTGDFYGITSGDTYNASSDSSATVGAPTGSVAGITSADFVDYAGGDYQPTSDGALADAGTDLSADFDDDITGTAR